MIGYTLVRSRRKTLALHVLPDATLEVRAPTRMPLREINRFVQQKEEWARLRIEQVAERAAARAAFAPSYGDSLPLLEELYPIVPRPGKRSDFDGAHIYMPPGLDASGVKRAAAALYRRCAKAELTARTQAFASRMGVWPSAIRITGAKARAGSCSGKNSVNFSWRLIMAAPDVVDYVCVHELAHIIEHNHSPRFWAVVAAVLPDFRQRQARLREFWRVISRQSWDD